LQFKYNLLDTVVAVKKFESKFPTKKDEKRKKAVDEFFQVGVSALKR